MLCVGIVMYCVSVFCCVVAVMRIWQHVRIFVLQNITHDNDHVSVE